MELIDRSGKRLYLAGAERIDFFQAAAQAPRNVRTFATVLLYTGCFIRAAGFRKLWR